MHKIDAKHTNICVLASKGNRFAEKQTTKINKILDRKADQNEKILGPSKNLKKMGISLSLLGIREDL